MCAKSWNVVSISGIMLCILISCSVSAEPSAEYINTALNVHYASNSICDHFWKSELTMNECVMHVFY